MLGRRGRWDAKPKHPVLGAHPCGLAPEALVEAGHDPRSCSPTDRTPSTGPPSVRVRGWCWLQPSVIHRPLAKGARRASAWSPSAASPPRTSALTTGPS